MSIMSLKITTLVVLFVSACCAQYGYHKSGESYANSNLGADGKSSGGYLGGDSGYKHIEKEIDYKAYPKYEFKYGVSDAHTGDNKEQQEVRDGDFVKGEYSVHEPDGTIRTVKYTSDNKNGFNAQVIRSGHAVHPETIIKPAFIVSGHKSGLESYGGH